MAEQLKFHIDMEPRSVWHLVTVDPMAKSEWLHVQEVGDFYANRNYYTTREGLDSYLIKLTLSGKGVLEYGNQTYELVPNTLFWIDCTACQHYSTDPREGSWHVLWVHFSGATAAAYYRAFLAAHQGKAAVGLSAQGASAVQTALRALLKLYEQGHGELAADIQASALLSGILAGCICDRTQNGETDPVPPTILAVKNHLDQTYGEHIDLDVLSERFSMSKYHLQRSFKRYFGVSPAGYLQSVRMAKAKQLLRTTALSINEVAFAVGFESPGYFITAFRNREGLTPQKYRKTWSNT